VAVNEVALYSSEGKRGGGGGGRGWGRFHFRRNNPVRNLQPDQNVREKAYGNFIRKTGDRAEVVTVKRKTHSASTLGGSKVARIQGRKLAWNGPRNFFIDWGKGEGKQGAKSVAHRREGKGRLPVLEAITGVEPAAGLRKCNGHTGKEGTELRPGQKRPA